jgi:phage tail P2-like protein
MTELYPVQNDYPDDYKIPPAERIERPGALTLYQQSTGFEKAAADTEAERLMDIYAEAIIDQWNPWQVAFEHLPFLAWAQGVNLWENWWDETFRRNWVARQWYLKSIRGKRAGLDEFVAAVGGRVKRCVVPPARAYGTKAQTPEERAAYVARFPQLRIYPYVAREQLRWLCFVGKHYDGTGLNRVFQQNGAFMGPLRPLYPTVQDAGGKYTRTATLYDPRTGVETVLTIRRVERIYTGENAGWGYTPGVSQYDETVILPLEKRPDYFIGESGKYLHGGGKFGIFLGKALPLRTISIGRSGPIEIYQGKAQYQTIFPQEEMLMVRPEYVAIRHPRRPTELYAARGEYLSRPSKLVTHLVPSPLAIGPPDFGRAVLKGFAGDDLEVNSPVLGVAVLKQRQTIVAENLVAPTPWFGEPGYRIKNATNLAVGAPAFSTAILRYAAKAANMTAGRPTFTVPAFKQAHKFNSFAIAVASPVLGRPGYGLRHVNLTVGAPVLGAPVLVHLF